MSTGSENNQAMAHEDGVFPYWSLSSSPAVYAYAGGVYELQAQGAAGGNQRLAPVWNEASSTYYVQLVEPAAAAAARYEFTHATREIRPYVSVRDTGIIVANADTGRRLKWRRERDGSTLVLIEEEENAGSESSSSLSTLALFKFTPDDSAPLACPRIAGARCQAYNLVASPGAGVCETDGIGVCETDGAARLALVPDNLIPFTLIVSNPAAAAVDAP
jgi:hypothetical protein